MREKLLDLTVRGVTVIEYNLINMFHINRATLPHEALH